MSAWRYLAPLFPLAPNLFRKPARAHVPAKALSKVFGVAAHRRRRRSTGMDDRNVCEPKWNYELTTPRSSETSRRAKPYKFTLHNLPSGCDYSLMIRCLIIHCLIIAAKSPQRL
jgi:hypothetical protein